jgi:hypothetical protein
MPRRELVIGDERWTGWALGEDDVWVLEARGHTPDEVLFYLPEHQLLHTADLTFPLFPTFPSSDGARTRAVLEKCCSIANSGAVQLLTDAHHHIAYRGRDDVVAFLRTLIFDHDHFQFVLRNILETRDGLTVAQIHATLTRRLGDPVVQHYLSLESPYLPMSLQQIIVVSLLEMGYTTSGPPGRHRFHRPTVNASGDRPTRLAVSR